MTTGTVLPELKLAPVREGVADALRRALLEGAFRPGQGLSEVELAKQLKVSRGPVKEALLILSQEGLLTHTQNYGFSVLNLTDRDIKEVAQVRHSLETLALTLARERVSPEDLSALEQLTAKFVEAASSGNVREVNRHDYRFHAMIAEISGNSWLEAALKRVLAPFFAFMEANAVEWCGGATPDRKRKLHEMYIGYLSGDCSNSAEDCVRSTLEMYSKSDQEPMRSTHQ